MTDAAAQVQKLLCQQAAIARFGSFALRERDLMKILAEAVRVCAEGLSVPFSKVCRYRAEENDLLIVAGHGWQDGVIGHVVSRADMSSPQGRAFTTGQPSIVDNLQADAGFDPPPFYAAHGIVSIIDVIIKGNDDQPYGILEIDNDKQHDYDQYDINFLTGFANVLAEAVSTASRGAALQVTVDKMKALVEEKDRLLDEKNVTEMQLRQVQKMEAVGQLTGGIAHDFNNLLTGIVGSLDLLQTRLNQGRTDNVARYINAAMTSANRAAALTHRLLAFARRQPLIPKSVDVNQLVVSLEDLLRRTIGETIDLRIVAADGLWSTLCDPNQLESALLNLAINARDAMPDGGRLTIATSNARLDSVTADTPALAPGDYVCITVTDSGVGMSAEVAARAFDPFFTTKPIGQGTGLGLSMIYGFARQSNGHVTIDSKIGQGTTVRLYLPRHHGDVAASQASAARMAEHAATGETVLVIEDEPVVRGVIVEMLAEQGYRTLEAVDGPSGLKILRSGERIDLLVTDVGLPGMNGRQVADQARESRPDLNILFITGYAESVAMADGFLQPGMEMITKPFDLDHLAQRVRAMISG
jgi:signal transduction histidine kinase/CheY-like chemotaxis protein